MSFFQIFRRSVHSDTFLVIKEILSHYKVLFTDNEVKRQIEEHPDHQSFLPIKDVLSSYGVQSVAVRKGNYSYSDFETPFVCNIQYDNWAVPNFALVLKAENDLITYLDPILTIEKTIAIKDYEKVDKGVVLLLDGDNTFDEPNFKENKKSQNRKKILGNMPYIFGLLPLIWVLFFFFINDTLSLQHWFSLIYFINSFIGLSVCILLLLHEVDAYNPFLKEVCGGASRKINCSAVLNSKGSEFLGISWSIWGFSYFLTLFISQLFFPGLVSQLSFWSIFSLFSVVYILYSFYYQAKIIKQWCPLCITIQVVLFFNAVISLFFIYYDVLNWNTFYFGLNILFGVGILMLCNWLIPIFKKAKNSAEIQRNWKKLKYHPDIFRFLLEKSESVSDPMEENIGIVVGNLEANREIIKVCNPYCGPCAAAHPKLEEIIRENPDVRLRIIFTANGDDADVKTLPVLHFLAIEEKYGVEKITSALDDWYSATDKNYELFAEKYPIKEDLKAQINKVYIMKNWCDKMKVRATPTLYIDGYELPDIYLVDDLKNVL